MNVQGMLPFENMVDDYIEETGNHVLYRVTPIFKDAELVARGVQMEARSVEDDGAGICFNVYVYNVQPGVEIDYATGESWLAQEQEPEEEMPQLPEFPFEVPEMPQEELRPEPEPGDGYVLNLNSKRIHRPDCSGVANMSPKNKQVTDESMSSLIERGYTPCGQCKPET
jgi:DNA-entry nuclease